MRIHQKTPRVERLSASSVARPEAEPVASPHFDPRTDLNARWYEESNRVLTFMENGRSVVEFSSAFIAALFSYATVDSRVRDRLRALSQVREWVVGVLNTQRDVWYQQLQGVQVDNIVTWPEMANLIQVFPEVRRLVNNWQVVNQLLLSEIWKQLSAFGSLHQRVMTLTNLRSLMQAWPELQPSIRTELVTRKATEFLLTTLEIREQADDWKAYGRLAKEMMLVFPDQQPYLREKLQGHLDPLIAETRQLYPDQTTSFRIERNAVLSARKAWIDEQGLLRLEYPAQTLARSVSMPDRLHT